MELPIKNNSTDEFNLEYFYLLFSLMELKPPISRAKMILITKAAIKAIKLYKHVVQIVEKFVKKCKPEFKVPGLYVIDSIVRQSRHQFGAEKDVFGPRFSKNITATFQYLYKCPFDEKSKIVRVLNLWQKNGVFRIEVIQPLLDMAAGTTATTAPPAIDSAANNARSPIPHPAPSQVPQITSDSLSALQQQLPNSDAFVAVAQLFQSTQGQQIQQILQNFQQPSKPQSPAVDNSIMSRVEAFTAQLKTAGAQPPEQKAAFDKKLLDRFDYDDEPEQVDDVKKEESIPSPMPPPPNGQLPTYGMGPVHSYPVMPQAVMPPASVQSVFQPDYRTLNEPQQEVDMEIEKPDMQESKRHHMENRRSRTRSGSRSPKRRRSRSGSRSRRSRHKRSRSRSRERERRRHSPRSRSQERREREKERERRQKGLPSIKSKTVSVCSTTLWIGQLDKRATQQDVANLLEEFGQIESLNMIPPRGCAYIVMVHRQDAYRALQKLSRGTFKVNQKPIKIAWALTKGMKAEYKQFWDVELGVSYIPWDKVKPEELEVLCEGGMLDNETLCPGKKQAFHPVNVIKAILLFLQMPGVQPISSVGRLHPPNFSALPPPTFNPGVPPPPPPPPPPPFMRPGFNPIQPPPGNLTHIGRNQGGTSHTPVTNVQPPSPGLLGARPGLIPLQRPPGVPPPHLQRFPVVPPRPLLPHLMHRGPPPPGPGGFGVPPPHGVRGPFPPQNLYGRPSAAEDRDGRQFRNDRHGFPPGRDRDQERFGRSEFRNRSFGGNRSESDNRDRYGNRQEDRDERQSGGRERWEWGRRSSERDRSRDSEERNRWSSGHRDSREKESRRDRDVDQRGKEKPEASVDEESEKDLRSNGDTQEEIIKPLDINPVAESAKEESESLNTDMKATYMKATEMVEMEPASSTKQPETENSGTTNEAQ
uniref:SR-related CTD associated factor 4 n=1 Tax=Callorhinchus milii TaxID=7868 RepID=A0A4W3IXT5_CALMI